MHSARQLSSNIVPINNEKRPRLRRCDVHAHSFSGRVCWCMEHERVGVRGCLCRVLFNFGNTEHMFSLSNYRQLCNPIYTHPHIHHNHQSLAIYWKIKVRECPTIRTGMFPSSFQHRMYANAKCATHKVGVQKPHCGLQTPPLMYTQEQTETLSFEDGRREITLCEIFPRNSELWVDNSFIERCVWYHMYMIKCADYIKYLDD